MATRSMLSDPDQLAACAICERTILLGEEPLSFSHQGRARTVCRLCASQARHDGWVEEGRAAPPPVAAPPPRGILRRVLGGRPQRPSVEPPRPVAAPAAAGADAEVTRAMMLLAAVEAFNASPYRATISGISKSLGPPRVSAVAFGGRRPGAAITLAWDLCWYRYLVEPAGNPQVRLDERGDAVAELAPRWRDWNARTTTGGLVELDIRPPGRPNAAHGR